MGPVGFLEACTLGNPYLTQYQTFDHVEIRKKPSLSATSLIRTVLYLASSDRGSDQALASVFDFMDDCPHRSSLSKARKKVSFGYFRDQLARVSGFLEKNRSTYGNLGLYAIDGHQLTLPCTEELLEKGYTGRSLENDQETYTLRAYVGHCCNVLSRTTTSVTFSPSLNEHRDRALLMESVPDHSLILYDRLYFSRDLVIDHFARNKVYFLARCRSNAAREITHFFQNSSDSVKNLTVWGTRLTLVRVTHPTTKELSVFATNLPESWHDPQIIADLYKMRWEVEIFQKDSVETAHGKTWHSKSENGILQEFYAKFWPLRGFFLSFSESQTKTLILSIESLGAVDV